MNAGVATQLLVSLFRLKGVLHYGIAGNADVNLEIGDVPIPRFCPHSGLWNWQVRRVYKLIVAIKYSFFVVVPCTYIFLAMSSC